MILTGQYDSPFVRRVGIALTLYGLPFHHQPWSVFGDGAQIQALNPLMRVPALTLQDGFVLTDSHIILDYLDGLVTDPLCPRLQPARRQVLQITALGTGLAEKSVSLFYETRMHDMPSALWQARCASQITATAAALEADRAARPGPWWFGNLTHADIAVACALRFTAQALPGLLDFAALPHLQAQCDRAEALPAFASVFQPFDATPAA